MLNPEKQWLTSVLSAAHQHAEAHSSNDIDDAIERVLSAASEEMELILTSEPCEKTEAR